MTVEPLTREQAVQLVHMHWTRTSTGLPEAVALWNVLEAVLQGELDLSLELIRLMQEASDDVIGEGPIDAVEKNPATATLVPESLRDAAEQAARQVLLHGPPELLAPLANLVAVLSAAGMLT